MCSWAGRLELETQGEQMFQFKGCQAGSAMLETKPKGSMLENSLLLGEVGLFVLFCSIQEEAHPHMESNLFYSN